MTEHNTALHELLQQLDTPLAQHFAAEEAAQLQRFTQHFYHHAAVDELAQWPQELLYGMSVSLWNFIQQRQSAQPKLSVFNPDFEEDGWQASHTIIQVLNPDRPFLVDSLRMELQRQQLAVHTIHNAILEVERDAQGRLVAVTNAEEGQHQAESLILIETDRLSDPQDLAELEDQLRRVLQEVQVVVEDFAAMRTQAQTASRALAAASHLNEADQAEASAFLDWLIEDRFTFLGYDEYRLEQGQWQRCEDQALGLLKMEQDPARLCAPDQLSADQIFTLVPELLTFVKSAAMSRVHRPAQPDYLSLAQYDAKGKLVGVKRFMGLYTSAVYAASASSIPVLRHKVEAVMQALDMAPSTHNGRQMQQLLDVYPRDDLFQIPLDELIPTALGIFNLRERRKVKVFVRANHYARLYSALVYLPRDTYSTELRQKAQKVLCETLNAEFVEFTTYFSESLLCRTQFILRFQGEHPADYDLRELEQRMVQATRSWNESLFAALAEQLGEESANRLLRLYRDGFSAAYCEDFTARHAVNDIQHFERLTSAQPIALSLYRTLETAQALRFKLYLKGESLPLSDVLPVLEHLGLRVLGEKPYEIERDGQTCWIHDFSLHNALSSSGALDLPQVKDVFQEAFLRTWRGEAESDGFNRLVLAAGLDWRQVALLRAYARYMKQIGSQFSQDYIAATLVSHPDIARQLLHLFALRFDPAHPASDATCAQVVEQIESALEAITSLSEDKILRRYIELIQATLRTNFYQQTEEGYRPAMSFKLSPSAISDMPQPCPRFEIFVYSPRVEGVHLRYGQVARGGLRWSDRHEDFRTEVLGLVKAQQVKNAVIVPVGAKGGFVCKKSPDPRDREAWMAEGIACYQTFIRSLLDVTDNLINQQLVPPAQVVRHDEDDPYLVVAADKGTATFSDLANAISAEYNFWLGDAFASGGSAGYDHKKMGITARGAWVSVQRHFREMGIDVQRQSVSVLGIGDMNGDVFGNGLLCSDQLQLVAAFNHKHIFIDPQPDPATSYAERQRLFALPRSGWDDYRPELISEGGGIFLRDAKSITITPQMQARFGLSAARMAPNELIHALLQSPVDLIWNGGIGTYVKGRHETHADAGDKANDSLRINGDQLRCKVVGEGGNLGWTQQGRIEAAQVGVRVNTDFIDNAGGVNCSDHEVNLKILLQQVMQAGDLTLKQRDQLLDQMTDEVAELVLRDNYSQAQALAIAELDSRHNLGHYRRLMNRLEEEGKLNRALEFLPTEVELQDREAEQSGLTRPELAVLLAYAKADIKNALLASEVPEDPWLGQALERAFPKVILERYAEPLKQHPLKRELIATMLVNELVDHMGITFVHRLQDTAGMSVPDIVRGYAVSRDVFGVVGLWNAIEALDHQLDAQRQLQLMHDLTRMMRRATRWFVRQRFVGLTAREAVDYFAPKVQLITEQLSERLTGEEQELWATRRDQLLAEGLKQEVAERLAGIPQLYSGLNIIQAERETGLNLAQVMAAYYQVGSVLHLPWLKQQIADLAVKDAWEAMAREAYRDELDDRHRHLALSVLSLDDAPAQLEERLAQWQQHFAPQVERWMSLLHEVRAGSHVGYPLFAVALRQLAILSATDLEG
ncbi:NAD-glutamate dehydrogenase [Marinospirillum sp.]|uniref:NAD-glutamate dehydrogenase n=1 Tax=Marinospirillum sp. TaxID=2183934 RepID=UPI003A855644